MVLQHQQQHSIMDLGLSIHVATMQLWTTLLKNEGVARRFLNCQFPAAVLAVTSVQPW